MSLCDNSIISAFQGLFLLNDFFLAMTFSNLPAYLINTKLRTVVPSRRSEKGTYRPF